MNKTFIIGTGYLSERLKKKIANSEIISANDFLQKINLINRGFKYNLIINTFYSSKKLNNLNSYKIFVEKSLLELSEVMDKINPNKVRKIIYSSSASVYGSINNRINIKDKNNRYTYSSFKLSAETLLKNFCNKKSIPLNICRIFNMYGTGENFSIISKLKNLKKNKKKIIIFKLIYKIY